MPVLCCRVVDFVSVSVLACVWLNGTLLLFVIFLFACTFVRPYSHLPRLSLVCMCVCIFFFRFSASYHGGRQYERAEGGQGEEEDEGQEQGEHPANMHAAII